MRKTTLLKKLISDEGILMMPGAFDALSAVIAEKAGFKAICLGGYPATASILGKPDISFLTLTEMTRHAGNIADAVDIPLLADGDTGHGGLLNVRRTVMEMEKAGVAGLFIEDQVFPKRCGHMEGKQVIPAEEMVMKLRAAVDARNDEDLVIMARTDAYAVRDLDEAIRRGNLYREAGADIIFVEAPLSVKDMKIINREVAAPTAANMVEGGKTPFLTAKELDDLGFDLVFYPVSALYAAAKSVRELFRTLAETGSTAGYAENMLTFDEFNKDVVDLQKYRKIESGYR